jgi:CRISPR-associated exonuclease Cas4
MIVLFAILILGGVVFLVLAFRQRATVQKEKRARGIPEGLVVYHDLNIPAEPLFSKRFRLVGKPDYIVRHKDRILPVEVKSGGQSHPQKSHMLQLAAYCQILEDVSGEFVPEGILVYNTVSYTIAFDPQLRFELASVTSQMRESLQDGVVVRNHQEPGRCKHCSLRQYCDDRVS